MNPKSPLQHFEPVFDSDLISVDIWALCEGGDVVSSAIKRIWSLCTPLPPARLNLLRPGRLKWG